MVGYLIVVLVVLLIISCLLYSSSMLGTTTVHILLWLLLLLVLLVLTLLFDADLSLADQRRLAELIRVQALIPGSTVTAFVHANGWTQSTTHFVCVRCPVFYVCSNGSVGSIETRHVSDTWKCGSLSFILTHPPEDRKKGNKNVVCAIVIVDQCYADPNNILLQ